VSIVISDGTPVVEVPRLRGVTAETADRRLRKHNLELGDIRPLDATATSVVRAQIPAAGISVDRDTRVRVFMSGR